MAICDCFSSDDHRVDDQGDLSSRQTAKPRHCTDLVCLSLFLVFWGVLIFIAVFAFIVGSPLRLIHGSDSFANTCGHQNDALPEVEFSGLDMTDKPYLFHLDASDPRSSLKICVKQCPTDELTSINDIYQFFQNTGSSLCRYDFDFRVQKRDYQLPQFDAGDQLLSCPKGTVVPTTPILYRCVPKLAVTQGYMLGHSVYEYVSSYVPLKKVINDLINSWKEMSIMIMVATICSFISAFIIHYIAGIASMIILTAVSITLVALTVFMWYAYYDARANLNRIALDERLPILIDDQDNEQIILFLSIAITIVSLILLLITLALRSRVRFVVALFKEAVSCLRAMPLLLIQPLWTLFSLGVFFIFWLSVLLALATAEHQGRRTQKLEIKRYDSRQIESSSGERLASFTLIDYNDPSAIQYMWWYLIIAFIWTSEFILSCQQMVIAGAVSKWYFTRDRSRISCPIGGSIRRLFSYHLGSVALGSLLITLLKLPRLVIAYFEKKFRAYDNFVSKCCLGCCTCCLWLIEKCVRYLNRNAYIVIAIEGTGFCTSASIALEHIVTNALRVTAINSVGDFVLFLGKVSVTAASAFVGSLLMKNNPMLHYWTIPVIVATIIAFWIAHCVLSVYEMIIDTLFLCFCIDYNRNDGSPGKEYYAPPSLLEFLTGEEVDHALHPLNSKRGE